jgi:hypothetical protein
MVDKANTTIVILIAAASFVVVFCLIASRALFSQASYQNRIINEKQKAVKTLRDNLSASASLVDSFNTFNQSPSLLGNTDTNSKIVLDALPSKYDFPALASSLEKILFEGGYKIDGISGTDEEVTQTKDASPNPQAIEIPFGIAATANYAAAQKLIVDFERSIRPFRISSIELSGSDQSIRLNIKAKTYFQPEKSLSITEKVVK